MSNPDRSRATKRSIVLLAASLIFPNARLQANPDLLSRDVNAYRTAHEGEIVGRLDTLVRIPSVAARPAALRDAADFLKSELRMRGFRVAQFEAKAGSPPVVFGEYPVAGATRTVLFYAHYDGQPVTPSQWNSDPFVPMLRSGPLLPGASKTAAPGMDPQSVQPPYNPLFRLFGRAAADDKASIVAFLAAFDALHALHRPPSANLKVLWEGEEEAGSPHLAEILRDHAAALKCDLLLIGDGPVHQSETPTLYFGARGVADLEMTIYGPNHPLHDGHYGNWAPNPAAMAADLIASMRDANGRILIPGFYEDVRLLTGAKTAAIGKLPPVDGALMREYGIGRSEDGQGLYASIMRPALNIRGISSGAVGTDATNAIPAEARVSIDFRLVPDQTPEGVREKVEKFLEGGGWTIVSQTPDLPTRLGHAKVARLDWGDGYPALQTDMTAPAARAAIAAASAAAGGDLACIPMIGGSVPIYIFHQILGAPVVGLPIVNHDDSQHAPNENLRLGNLWEGIDIYAAMMAELNW